VAEERDLLSSLLMELHRGTLVLCVLSQMKKPTYGYALVQTLEEKGVQMDPNTLYPLLRRLESQGLLESKWETGGAKPRKYYQRTQTGTQTYQQLKERWKVLNAGMNRLFEEDEA
jgi:PadR family transcriptional regulator PadR